MKGEKYKWNKTKNMKRKFIWKVNWTWQILKINTIFFFNLVCFPCAMFSNALLNTTKHLWLWLLILSVDSRWKTKIKVYSFNVSVIRSLDLSSYLNCISNEIYSRCNSIKIQILVNSSNLANSLNEKNEILSIFDKPLYVFGFWWIYSRFWFFI